jgi:alpha-mannosidase
MVHDNILDLNLLRSPSNPDPDADKGTHRFTYSLLPHHNDLINSSVLAESSCLNQEPLLFEGMASKIDIPIKLFGEGLELSVFKKAEKEDVWVLRIIETLGKKSSGSVQFNGELVECDLMEWSDLGESHLIEDSFNLTLEPFEIKTFKVSF